METTPRQANDEDTHHIGIETLTDRKLLLSEWWVFGCLSFRKQQKTKCHANDKLIMINSFHPATTTGEEAAGKAAS